MRYSYDLTKPAGPRLIKAEIVNPDSTTAPIDPAKSYKVIVNDFVARGGDGFSAIKEEPFVYNYGPNLDGVSAC